MLAGLIFATEDADDKAGTLAETLPFGGLTLIEFQARLLIAAGATQIVLAVARMTPGLLGAISRIGRRGVSVDAVRTAAEAIEKLHPLARVLVVADGLVTTGDAVMALVDESGEGILVIDDEDPAFERIGVATAWAGMALVEARRIADVAALPRDYDFQSTLLRVIAQSGAAHVHLPAEAEIHHAIERDSRALAALGNATIASLVARPVRWADRYIAAPLARAALPHLFAQGVPTWPLGAGTGVLGLIGLAAIYFGWGVVGLVTVLVAALLGTTGSTLAWLRDEDGLARGLAIASPALSALSVVAVGGSTGQATGWMLAVGALVASLLVERITRAAHPRRWWSSPLAAPLLMLAPVLVGEALVAVGVVTLYAVVTLASAIEGLSHEK
ncbi:hypothetical protein [Sphingomonas immobilis]|uniref:Uncharacterized protein n=1 Tax=Sphingomonas immobilis TaxID=3063997 RepID=A0ABT8ZV51_9SPHN|nr:hypothetical protein [Sphingomonas sp. CA1-15]MDO7841143.1 hypothetical protein [Sphingomonas sp. CA1-15]